MLGTPSSEDMAYIANESAKKYIKSSPAGPNKSGLLCSQKQNPIASDLLSSMLVFSPDKRYSVQQCLSHPYFEGLHNPEEEPLAEVPFDWSFDDFEPTKDILQNMIYDEALKLHFE